MLIALGDGWAVALSSMTWFVTSLVVGRWATSWSLDRLATTGPVTRPRGWERGGSFWQARLRVRRWKDRLPEAGEFFAGGYSKRRVRSRRTEDLDRFRAETVRAERVHWTIAATGPLHLVWCRPAIGVSMIGFGLVFNAPFIVVQRTNRGRLDRLLARREGTGSR